MFVNAEMFKIVIILPAFNEAGCISVILDGINAQMKKYSLDFLILVVNDGSTDETQMVVEKCAARVPLQLLNHTGNQGVGMAFLTGFKKATEVSSPNDIIILMEADNTSEIDALLSMVDKIKEGYDIVCASRHIRSGGYINFPFKRLVLSQGVNFMLRFIFQIPQVTDYSIFYRAYRASIIKDAFLHYGDNFIQYRGFVANVEVLLKLSRLGARFAEVPLQYDYGFKKTLSKMRIRKTINDYLRFIWGWKCRA